MQVGAIGVHITNPEVPVRLELNAAPVTLNAVVHAGEDSVAPLLAQMTTTQITSLIGEILKEHMAHDLPSTVELLRNGGAGVGGRDAPPASAKLGELIVQPPHGLDHGLDHGLETVRGDIENLFHGQLMIARSDAEQKLIVAAHAFESLGSRGHSAEMDVPLVLTTAHQLLATDQYQNVLLAAGLVQCVTDFCGRKRAEVNRREVTGSKGNPGLAYAQILQTCVEVAQRIPAKFQLLLWLALGAMSGMLSLLLRLLEVGMFSAALPLEIWGAGSIGLLGFGTYRRVRKRGN